LINEFNITKFPPKHLFSKVPRTECHFNNNNNNDGNIGGDGDGDGNGYSTRGSESSGGGFMNTNTNTNTNTNENTNQSYTFISSSGSGSASGTTTTSATAILPSNIVKALILAEEKSAEAISIYGEGGVVYSALEVECTLKLAKLHEMFILSSIYGEKFPSNEVWPVR
jgi:hypothetical protein